MDSDGDEGINSTATPPKDYRPPQRRSHLRARVVQDFPKVSTHYLTLREGDVVTVTEVVSVPYLCQKNHSIISAMDVFVWDCLSAKQRLVER